MHLWVPNRASLGIKNDLKLYIYPLKETGVDELTTTGNLRVAHELRNLYKYLIDRGCISAAGRRSRAPTGRTLPLGSVRDGRRDLGGSGRAHRAGGS